MTNATWTNADRAERSCLLACCATPWSDDLADRAWSELPVRTQEELQAPTVAAPVPLAQGWTFQIETSKLGHHVTAERAGGVGLTISRACDLRTAEGLLILAQRFAAEEEREQHEIEDFMSKELRARTAMKR